MASFDFVRTGASEAGFSARVLGELDGLFEAKVAAGELPGHEWLLIRGDQLVHHHVTGYADWQTKAELEPNSIFALFSMTKPLTAAAMLLLFDEGRWQFDDPVSLYLPEFRDIANLPGSRATREPAIREIFTHTAGFSFGKTHAEMEERLRVVAWDKVETLDELIARYAGLPLDYEPGTAWEYSGATDLEAAIVERLTGERFDAFLARRLFGPLGMTDTAFALSPAQQSRLAPSHNFDAQSGGLRYATAEERMESAFPMGGTSFKSTALDFARFARMILNGGMLGDVRILQPGTVDLMLANHVPEDLPLHCYWDAHYKIGEGNGQALNAMVCIDPARAGRPVGKGTYEWGGAFGTWFWIDPENDVICIGMTNRRRLPADGEPLQVAAQSAVYRALESG